MMDKPELPTDKQLEMIKMSAEITNLKAVRMLDKSMGKASSWRRASLSSLVVIFGLSAALLIQPYKPVAANIQPLPAQIKQVPVDLNPAQLAQIIEAVKAKPVIETRFVNVVKKPIKVKKAVFKAKKPHKKHVKPITSAVQEKKFIPEIDRVCPEHYELRQPGVCFSPSLKKIIFL
jgi:hypothetical protein